MAGQSIRIVQRFYDDGTTGLFGDVSGLTFRQRVSGKSFCYWRTTHTASLRWTKAGLLLLRTASHESGSNGGHRSTYIFGKSDAEWFFSYLLRHYNLRQVFRRRQGGQRVILGPENLGDYDHATEELFDDITHLIGDIPSFEERFPINSWPMMHEGTYRLFVDAADWREVTRRAFSQYNVKKPLVKAVSRLEGSHLPWFRAFRGLVPIDWIIESMNRTDRSALERTPHVDERTLRRILRELPQSVLRRILNEPIRQAVVTMNDACQAVRSYRTLKRDITPLNELIAARGQKNVRGSRDVEQLIFHRLPEITDPGQRNLLVSKRSSRTTEVLMAEIKDARDLVEYNALVEDLPDRESITWKQWQDPQVREQARDLLDHIRRERQTRQDQEREARRERQRQRRMQEQAERAAWASELTEKLQGLRIGDHTVHVATEPGELRIWGEAMGNCIGIYANRVGLDVLGAVKNADGQVVLNFEITKTLGLNQLLGRFNTDAQGAVGHDHAQRVLDGLVAAGVEIDAKDMPLGAAGLRIPELVPA